MSLRTLKALLVSLSLAASTSAFAVPLVVDLTGINSVGLIGAPGNSVYTFDIGANSLITGISYNFNVTAYSPSWLSELGLTMTNSKQTEGVDFHPGIGLDFSGTQSFSGVADLVPLGLDFYVGNDGILRLEFFEDFDDSRVNPDGRWNFGTITFDYTPQVDPTDPTDVPEPATALLLGGGAMLMGFAGRRRKAAKAPETLAA